MRHDACGARSDSVERSGGVRITLLYQRTHACASLLSRSARPKMEIVYTAPAVAAAAAAAVDRWFGLHGGADAAVEPLRAAEGRSGSGPLTPQMRQR